MGGSGYWNVSDIDKLTVKGDFNGCMKTARGLSHCHEVCVQNQHPQLPEDGCVDMGLTYISVSGRIDKTDKA